MFEFASDELKDDKEDETVVLAAVKTTSNIITGLCDEILINHLIYETACYYKNVNFRDDFLLKIN